MYNHVTSYWYVHMSEYSPAVEGFLPSKSFSISCALSKCAHTNAHQNSCLSKKGAYSSCIILPTGSRARAVVTSVGVVQLSDSWLVTLFQLRKNSLHLYKTCNLVLSFEKVLLTQSSYSPENHVYCVSLPRALAETLRNHEGWRFERAMAWFCYWDTNYILYATRNFRILCEL